MTGGSRIVGREKDNVIKCKVNFAVIPVTLL